MNIFFNNLRILWKTLKGERHLIISGLLLIVIPAATIFNTLFLINHIRKDINTELARMGDQLTNVIGRSVRDHLANPGEIDAIIGDIVRENSDIKSIDVLIPVSEKNDINYVI